ncbi:hypothetical protein [Calothrix sp. NIES-2098]|uniref:hypothetical protein n=1 Tax=Calothrix sp. NIES-2098 TaxID=1954171 RepID=UPI000B5EFDE6|nr:hypothetical protein NIES2098_73570 [Calothrix sp. NIES-2098]
MTTTLDLSKFLYCRNCGMKTQHYKDLKYDWGYSCRTCTTWQHQSQLFEIQQGYPAALIVDSMKDDEIKWAGGNLQNFIEAAHALELEYDYQKTEDGYDFLAWHPDDEEKSAQIRIATMEYIKD